MGIVTLVVQSVGIPLSDVTINILDSNGVMDSTSSTDEEGKAIFDLTEGADYFVTATHANHYISAYKIKALELGTYDLIAVQKQLKPSDDPRFCLIQGQITDLSNSLIDSWNFTVEAAEGYAGTEDSIFYGDLEVKSDNGLVEFSLLGGMSYVFKHLPFC